MLPNWKPAAYAAGAILLVLIGVYSLGYRMGQAKVLGVATQAEMDAREAKGEADALKVQAQAKDAEIAARDNRLADASAEVERQTAALRSLRAKVHDSGTANAGEQPILAGPEYLDTDNLIAISIKQEELINSQAELIKQQDVKISTLIISRDAWKGSAEAREREAAGLRIALEAQKSATRGALWKGRIQGLAVGLGSGYLAGKR